ncbi:MAG: hypothetical protein AB8G15_03760 [Saprospiraceae bacterium]
MISTLIFMMLSFLDLTTVKEPTTSACYDRDYVEVANVEYENEKYSVVYMQRSGQRVRAKYFAAKDYAGNRVHERYENWKNTNTGIILVSSGTYWNEQKLPEGLTIDNGVIVNQAMVHNKMDALTIVYATGGIVVSDLRERNLKVSGGGIDASREFDLRGSSRDLRDFKKWAARQEATVFQTHLLVYGDELKISNNADRTPRERRFLAVCKNEDGDIIHTIIHRPTFASLYNSTKGTKKFLNDYAEMEVIFMINIDVGFQDVFELRNWDCSVNKTIKGTKQISEAANLLVYYFK